MLSLVLECLKVLKNAVLSLVLDECLGVLKNAVLSLVLECLEV